MIGPGQKILTWVGLGQPSMAWGWGWKISPKNIKFLNFFPSRIKKISSGWVKKYPGQRRIGLLFTVDQKYARVGSGPISRWTNKNLENVFGETLFYQFWEILKLVTQKLYKWLL